VNLYGSFGFARDWSKYNGKIGLALLESNTTVDNRITMNSENTISWYHRTTARINDFRIGVVAGLNLTTRELIKKDILLGYQMNDLEVVLKAEQAFGKKTLDYGDWRQWFNKYIITSVYRRSRKERYGL